MPFQSHRCLAGHRLVRGIQGAQAHRDQGTRHTECQTVCPSFGRHRLASDDVQQLDERGDGQQRNREMHHQRVKPPEQEPAPPWPFASRPRQPRQAACSGAVTRRMAGSRAGDGRVCGVWTSCECRAGSRKRPSAGMAAATTATTKRQSRLIRAPGARTVMGPRSPRRRAAYRVYVVEFRRTSHTGGRAGARRRPRMSGRSGALVDTIGPCSRLPGPPGWCSSTTSASSPGAPTCAPPARGRAAAPTGPSVTDASSRAASASPP